MTRLLLAGVGSGRDPATWSGTAFHLLTEGRRQGLVEDDLGLVASSPAWTARRIAWNLASAGMGRGWGGFQFTDRFLERLWRPVSARIRDRHVMNWTQLYPTSVLMSTRVQRSYFIDQTLGQLFDDYGVGASIRQDVAESALAREAEGYRRATAIVVHSGWARQAVLGIEGVDPARVHVVVPGANLEPNAYRAWSEAHRSEQVVDGGPLRLVFVGRHPTRKGLDRLLRALRLAREGGADLRLDVVGTQREEVGVDLRAVEGVVWHGRIDKSSEASRFFEVVSSAHVGCLLSRAEAGGIGLREFHALGLAVIGPRAGGSPDHVIREAAVLVSPTASDHDVAAILSGLARDPGRVNAMRAVSWERREDVGWRTAVARLREILP